MVEPLLFAKLAQIELGAQSVDNFFEPRLACRVDGPEISELCAEVGDGVKG
jgi:hypothetical protein